MAEGVDGGGEGKRPKFGSRYLTDPTSVFEHNAWDDVQVTPEQEEHAQQVVQFHLDNPVPEERRDQYNEEPAKFWDAFYSIHEHKFFKDRNWLFTDFPELLLSSESALDEDETLAREGRPEGGQGDACASVQRQASASTSMERDAPVQAGQQQLEAAPGEQVSPEDDPSTRWSASAHCTKRILEVGCGAGNTVFPILAKNPDPNLFVYACDYAPSAVQVVKSQAAYDTSRCRAFVCDISADDFHLPDNSMDIVVMIFVLSALHPEEMKRAAKKVAKVLKPGGLLLFRDYGRHDLAQLRLKAGRLLEQNLYIRGDGTRVYFAETDEIRELFTSEGLVEEMNKYDRRLIVNRAKRITMQRVWVQAKFRKPTQ
eukprot:m.213339 g.213339  ORF g.213339 m.213339 type:complete len:370 (+) comp15083_c2_seq5:835-1944(+)